MPKTKIPVNHIVDKLAEEVEKAQRRSKKASEVLLGPLDTSIGTTPYEVVYKEDRVKLKYYRPSCKKQIQTPLLLIYALINRETMLDLQPGRSVIKSFLDLGMEVYMIDWGYPTRKDRFLTIDDHVNGYIDHVVDYVRQTSGFDKINIMGICMGGTFSVIYAAQHPRKVKNLITTVTPTNFNTDQGLLHVWMREAPVEKMVDTFGNMPGDLLNFGFLLLNPARLMLDKYIGFFEHADDKNFVENFLRMEKWIFDSPDVPGETFRQFIKDCYQKNLLIQNKMQVGGKRVDLNKITMPLLNIYGQYDHLVPPGACDKITQVVGSKDTQDVCLKTGHIGIYVSSKCQMEFAPNIFDWLKEREGVALPPERRLAPNTAKVMARHLEKSKAADCHGQGNDLTGLWGTPYPLEPNLKPPWIK